MQRNTSAGELRMEEVMEITQNIEIPVLLTLKELADLEDKSLKIADNSDTRLFTIEKIEIVKSNMFQSSAEKPIMATAMLVFNGRSIAKNEFHLLLKKMLKIR